MILNNISFNAYSQILGISLKFDSIKKMTRSMSAYRLNMSVKEGISNLKTKLNVTIHYSQL